MPSSHPLLLASALVALALAAIVPARGQQPAAPAQRRPDPTQLDRIERKLDEILQRLDQLQRPPEQTALPSPAQSRADGLPTAAETSYKPGAVATARAVPERAEALNQIPADSVGGFIYQGGPIPLHDLRGKGVRYTGITGLELQGWLKVTQAGRTQIGVEYRALVGANVVIGPSCALAAWLESRSIGTETGRIKPSSQEQTLSLLLGADLQPGLYQLRLWTACTPTRDLRVNAEVLIKMPADMNLRPVTVADLLHQQG